LAEIPILGELETLKMAQPSVRVPNW